MQKVKYRSSQVPTIVSSGIKTSPYRSSSLYMELHKLDYKKKVLLEKKLELEKKKYLLDKQLANLESEMDHVSELLEKRNIENERSLDLHLQKLKY